MPRPDPVSVHAVSHRLRQVPGAATAIFARATSRGYRAHVANAPAPAPARNFFTIAARRPSVPGLFRAAANHSWAAKCSAAYGATRSITTPFPFHRARTPSCCARLCIFRAAAGKLNCSCDVWKMILTRSSGASIVFAVIPAMPPDMNERSRFAFVPGWGCGLCATGTTAVPLVVVVAVQRGTAALAAATAVVAVAVAAAALA